MHVLFVCNGNVCRSAIAERLAVAIASELGLTGLSAESAGTRALVGFPMEPVAAEVLRGLGGDPSGFVARRLRPEMIDRADLVLAMSESVRDEAVRVGPAAAHRTFTLPEAHRIVWLTGARTVDELAAGRDLVRPGRGESISDPVGLRGDAFERVGEQIAEALLQVIPALHAAGWSEVA
ncbi:low molecular weight phosphatase family protein [Rhodococcus sp. NPDC058514]|uniref:arsenate reductase/protein-tyrosine-phosphatase family protein n=1 Tax=unclassified Rhodococcus (in: high G+C Gram-positive bacteria) TaxID=192944 RepID=UPI0036671442